jgi:hypothetical protein
MNKREHLLTETLVPGDGEAFARRAAAHARHRRLAKQAGLAAGLTCVLAAALMMLPPPRAVQSSPIAVTPVPAAPTLEIMSDQELLAQLKDQSVLVLKDQTGITGVIFLADAAPTPSGWPSNGL